MGGFNVSCATTSEPPNHGALTQTICLSGVLILACSDFPSLLLRSVLMSPEYQSPLEKKLFPKY